MSIRGVERGLPPRAGRRRVALRATAALLACLAAAGCVAGPNFKTPPAPDVHQYTREPIDHAAATPGVTGGAPQQLSANTQMQGDWWTLFHSQTLDDLIGEGLKNNHDLKAAQAALKAAHEGVLSQRGAYYPTVTAGFGATRQRTSGALAPTPFNNAQIYSLITPEVSVTYTPDVFGLNRRTVEQVKAQEDQTRYELYAADLTLTSNIANAYIQDAALQGQIDATKDLIEIDAKSVDILKEQFAKGYASKLDLAAQESALAQQVATLPGLTKQELQTRDLLAVLVGRYPEASPDHPFELAALQLPQDLPLSLPSELVRQRPDILQAEANLHMASAGIGIARANRLPNIQLTADAGTMALTFGKIFANGAEFWDYGLQITQTVFDAGQLKHKETAAKDLFVQANEQYKSTVLTAFQNVADTLVALDQDAKALQANAAASDAAKTTLDLSQEQYKRGYASYLTLLSAEQGYQSARINLVQAQAARYADTVALYQALGGGWWHRSDLVKGKDGR
ncbi:MAG TPA: efflux transporter outer membrane subunit [Caulobacteraceae bacterium]|jgi:NodT family efflux transporter outer membrane factor (OMF) lipoprotein